MSFSVSNFFNSVDFSLPFLLQDKLDEKQNGVTEKTASEAPASKSNQKEGLKKERKGKEALLDEAFLSLDFFRNSLWQLQIVYPRNQIES